MNTLTSTQEQRLEDALLTAIKDYNTGSAPNEALYKAASSYSLEPEFVRRLTQVFNSAAQLAHFKKAASAGERKSEFELGDADHILGKLYPTKEAICKEAAAPMLVPAYPAVESVDFNQAPKQATAGLPKINLPQYQQGELRDLERKVFSRIDMLKKAVDEARTDLTEAKMGFCSSLSKISSYFRRMDRMPFSEVETRLRSNIKTASAKQLFDMAYTHIKGASLREKRGEPSDSFKAYDPSAEPYCYFEQALADGEKMAECLNKVQNAELAASEFEDAARARLRKISEATGNFPKRAADAGTMAVVQALKKFLDKQTGEGEYAFPVEHAVEKSIGEVISPQVRTEEATSNAELMLHDFMRNDDVISGYDPRRVAGAFNEISMLTPRSIQQPMVMRGLLRRYLQQGYFEPIEVGQATGLEGDIKNIEEPPKIPELTGSAEYLSQAGGKAQKEKK